MGFMFRVHVTGYRIYGLRFRILGQ